MNGYTRDCGCRFDETDPKTWGRCQGHQTDEQVERAEIMRIATTIAESSSDPWLRKIAKLAIAAMCPQAAPSAKADERENPALYVRFGPGLRDESGDRVDFIVDTKPFDGAVKYETADTLSAMIAKLKRIIAKVRPAYAFCHNESDHAPHLHANDMCLCRGFENGEMPPPYEIVPHDPAPLKQKAPTDEQVERVARAIADSQTYYGWYDVFATDSKIDLGDVFRKAARAAIAAMSSQSAPSATCKHDEDDEQQIEASLQKEALRRLDAADTLLDDGKVPDWSDLLWIVGAAREAIATGAYQPAFDESATEGIEESSDDDSFMVIAGHCPGAAPNRDGGRDRGQNRIPHRHE